MFTGLLREVEELEVPPCLQNNWGLELKLYVPGIILLHSRRNILPLSISVQVAA